MIHIAIASAAPIIDAHLRDDLSDGIISRGQRHRLPLRASSRRLHRTTQSVVVCSHRHATSACGDITASRGCGLWGGFSTGEVTRGHRSALHLEDLLWRECSAIDKRRRSVQGFGTMARVRCAVVSSNPKCVGRAGLHSAHPEHAFIGEYPTHALGTAHPAAMILEVPP